MFAGTSGSRRARATWPKRDRRRLSRISLIVDRPDFWSTSAVDVEHLAAAGTSYEMLLACLCRQPEVSRFQLRIEQDRLSRIFTMLDTDALWCAC